MQIGYSVRTYFKLKTSYNVVKLFEYLVCIKNTSSFYVKEIYKRKTYTNLFINLV